MKLTRDQRAQLAALRYAAQQGYAKIARLEDEGFKLLALAADDHVMRTHVIECFGGITTVAELARRLQRSAIFSRGGQ